MTLNPPRVRMKYPGMSRYDSQLWTSFLLKHPNYFDIVAYNVRCGKGDTPLPGIDARYYKCWSMITQRRIDVVGVRKGHFYIIEVKPRLGTSTPRQALAYKRLLERDLRDKINVIPMVIYIQCESDMLEVCNSLKIKTIQITP